MLPYDRKVPFLGTTKIDEQFHAHVTLVLRFREATGIDNRPLDQRGSGHRLKMSGCEVWQLLSFLDIIGWRPGLGVGGQTTQVQATEWMWRPVLEAIEQWESGFVAMTPSEHRVAPPWAAIAEEDPHAIATAAWALNQPFAAIYHLAPPASLTDWLHLRWVEAHT